MGHGRFGRARAYLPWLRDGIVGVIRPRSDSCQATRARSDQADRPVRCKEVPVTDLRYVVPAG